MAKKSGLKKTIKEAPKIIQVKSSTYGVHTRAARGSKSPAALNDTVGGNAKNTQFINRAASAVYAALVAYSRNFKEGQLWQHILSRMRKAGSTDFGVLLACLEGLELNSRYKLSRFGDAPFVNVATVKKAMHITLQQYHPPDLEKDDAYQYAVIAAFFNNAGSCVGHSQQVSGPAAKNTVLAKPVFVFTIPAKAKYYCTCLHLQGVLRGNASTVFTSNGMQVAEVGVV